MEGSETNIAIRSVARNPSRERIGEKTAWLGIDLEGGNDPIRDVLLNFPGRIILDDHAPPVRQKNRV
jgi:hypothetical protein